MESDLFDFIESRELRDEAIQRVSTRTYWLDLAVSAVEAVSLQETTFTSDSVLIYEPRLEECPELRVLGGAFNKLHKARVIEPTDKMASSSRKKSHGRPKREWRRCFEAKL